MVDCNIGGQNPHSVIVSNEEIKFNYSYNKAKHQHISETWRPNEALANVSVS